MSRLQVKWHVELLARLIHWLDCFEQVARVQLLENLAIGDLCLLKVVLVLHVFYPSACTV